MNKLNENKLMQKNLLAIEFDKYFDLPYHVYLKNTKGIFLECNVANARCMGFENPADVVGTDERDYISESEFAVINSNDKNVFYTETPRIIVESVQVAKRPLSSYLSYKMPVRSLTGVLIGIFGISIAQDSKMISSLMPVFNLAPPAENIKQPFSAANKVSKRERECLNYLIQGKTAKEIARALNISHRTVEFYIEKMKQKFNCANRIELVARAFDLLAK